MTGKYTIYKMEMFCSVVEHDWLFVFILDQCPSTL
jgi:hypothetical protein